MAANPGGDWPALTSPSAFADSLAFLPLSSTSPGDCEQWRKGRREMGGAALAELVRVPENLPERLLLVFLANLHFHFIAAQGTHSPLSARIPSSVVEPGGGRAGSSMVTAVSDR